MALIEREYTAHPFRGSRGMTSWLRGEGHAVNRKRVQRLMRLMGLEAVYPKPRLSIGGAGHKVYPYLLRDVAIERVNQVWSTDITYIPMPNGFMYLTAVMDWHSRYVLSWKLSNTLDTEFCLEALEEALRRGCPEVFNTDQESAVHATEVDIRESYGNGFVYQVDLLDTDGALHTVWTGTDPTQPGSPTDFVVKFAATPYVVKGVKIYVNTDHDLNAWEEIDAVRLLGE